MSEQANVSLGERNNASSQLEETTKASWKTKGRADARHALVLYNR